MIAREITIDNDKMKDRKIYRTLALKNYYRQNDKENNRLIEQIDIMINRQ